VETVGLELRSIRDVGHLLLPSPDRPPGVSAVSTLVLGRPRAQ
jgi:hypothetical protein